MTDNELILLVKILLIICSIILIVMSFIFHNIINKRFRECRKVQGNVVAFTSKRFAGNNKPSYYAVVQFIYNGTEYNIEELSLSKMAMSKMSLPFPVTVRLNNKFDTMEETSFNRIEIKEKPFSSNYSYIIGMCLLLGGALILMIMVYVISKGMVL